MKVKSTELCMQNYFLRAQDTELESSIKSEDTEIWEHGAQNYEDCVIKIKNAAR